MNDSAAEEQDGLGGQSRGPGRGRPIIFGEVLWDHFPDGRKVLGGAPFNVAWNLKGLGFDPYFVSAVGADDDAEAVRDKMISWGLDLAGLQTIPDRPTGTVAVTLQDNQPSYEIVRDQAYDFIRPLDVEDLSERCSLLYHGSLVFRQQRSRETLRELIHRSGLPRFVDVNIRQPHFDREWLPDLIGGASWVKLNHEELGYLSGVPIDDSVGEADAPIEAAVTAMHERYGPATYFVTFGSRGAYAITASEKWFSPAVSAESFSDSVGAGDAFAAATIAGILREQPPQQSLQAASRFASRICGIKGGTTHDRAVYERGLS